MKIVNLIEDSEGRAGCAHAHGLSFYIETDAHKLLVDTGPSEAALDNAAKLGIDLACVDTVILSHGHYDHSGGIIPFVNMNNHAKIYMQRKAVGEYYADHSRYIGIDARIADLSQVEYVDGDLRIDDELELFTIKRRNHEIPFTNKRLFVKNEDGYAEDSFEHEQYVAINSEGRRILVSGCAHNGMPNILDAYTEKYGAAPDMVISGFHLMKNEPYTANEQSIIEDMARKLTCYPTHFITCHCTGAEAYGIMKKIMGEKLQFVHSGERVI